MIVLAEKWEARDEREHAKANLADYRRIKAGGGDNEKQPHQPQQPPKKAPLQPGPANPCYCCGSHQHFFRSCTKKELSCNNCKKKGHLAHMCKGDNTVAEQQPTSTDGAPKKVTFPKGTKKETAPKCATVMTAEIIDVDTSKVSEVVSTEWLTDSGASRHICHDKRMLWDLRELETPVIVRQMVGQVPVTHCGTVRVECENEAG